MRLSSALLHTLGDACAEMRLSSALLHTLGDACAEMRLSSALLHTLGIAPAAAHGLGTILARGPARGPRVERGPPT